MLEIRGWRVNGSALASPLRTSSADSTSATGSVEVFDPVDPNASEEAFCCSIFADFCGSRMMGLNSSVILIENTPPMSFRSGTYVAGHTGPHIRKTSTYPEEATYPCCIPALGELGDIPPRGGKD